MPFSQNHLCHLVGFGDTKARFGDIFALEVVMECLNSVFAVVPNIFFCVLAERFENLKTGIYEYLGKP